MIKQSFLLILVTFSLSGMCKHLHTALTAAAARGINIENERANRAKHLYESSAYTIDGSSMTVLDDEVVSVVNMAHLSCMCVAFSHKIDCICKETAMLHKTLNSSEATYSIPVDDSESLVQVQPEVAIPDNTFKDMLQDINNWAESITIIPSQVLAQARRLHQEIFGKHQNIYRHKKNVPLHPYRKSIMKAINVTNDHQYGNMPDKKPRLAKRTVKTGGSFVIKSRKTRHDFKQHENF